MPHDAARWLLGLFACAACLLAAPSAQAGELQLEFHGAGQHAYDPSFDAFGHGQTPNVFFSGNVGIGYEVGELFGADGLLAYAVVGRASSENRRFDDTLAFRWRRMSYLGGAEYGYDLTGFLRPFVRVTAGATAQNVRLKPDSADAASQTKWAFATRNSAGLEIHTPYGAGEAGADGSNSPGADPPLALADNLSLGLTLEAGYLWQTKTEFDALGPSETDSREAAWQTSGPGLGRLDTNGWFWAVGAMVRVDL